MDGNNIYNMTDDDYKRFKELDKQIKTIKNMRNNLSVRIKADYYNRYTQKELHDALNERDRILSKYMDD